MTIDPKTLPEGAVVETNNGHLCFKDGKGYQNYRDCLGDGSPWPWRDRTITRVYIPAPEGMTVEDADAALADAGAWVEVAGWDVVPDGARLRNEWVRGRAGDRTYVHRDDLPPTDPDAELVAAIEKSVPGSWDGREVLRRLRAALAVVREHEAAR